VVELKVLSTPALDAPTAIACPHLALDLLRDSKSGTLFTFRCSVLSYIDGGADTLRFRVDTLGNGFRDEFFGSLLVTGAELVSGFADGASSCSTACA
jgi:hypothetical protein